MARSEKKSAASPRSLRSWGSRKAIRWRKLALAWENSGLSQVEFCRRRKVSVHTFRWWRYRFGSRSKPKPSPRIEEGRAPASPPFVELKFSGFRPAAPTGEVAIELPGGPVVRVCPGFDAETLRKVLVVLEARGC